MKVKLLKKIRKRFKWKYLGRIEEVFNFKGMPICKYWEVLDSNGTKPQKMEHISHFCIGDFVRIHCPTIAEQLAIDVMGIGYVYEHRVYRDKMKNKSFKKKYFS